MHLLLYHFYSRTPNPVYQEIAGHLRGLGHTVWLGSRDEDDNLAWHDGESVVARIKGPYSAQIGKGIVSKIYSNLYYLYFMWRLRSFVVKVQPDIVQANIASFGWLLPLAGPRRTTFIYDIRQINESVNHHWQQRFIEVRTILMMQICSKFIYHHTFFCHERAARKILGTGWAERSTVIPVGIDKQFLSTPAFHRSSNLGADQSTKIRFVYVGTLSRLRGLEKLIQAASLAHAKGAHIQLDFIGPDTSNGYYQKTIHEFGVADFVSIQPPIAYDRVPHALLSYDVGLAYVPDRPTWHYQPTIKVLEYRALGLPILSTDVATHREIICEDKNGILTADTPDALAEGMLRYVKDRQFLRDCQKNAQLMRCGTTWFEVAQMYNEVYQKFYKGR